MLSISQALVGVAAMALVIFLCRAIPFIFFARGKDSPLRQCFIAFVERIVPPVAMTALALTAILPALKSPAMTSLPTIVASLATAAVHLWRRNALLSIAGGTALYMLLSALLVQG